MRARLGVVLAALMAVSTVWPAHGTAADKSALLEFRCDGFGAFVPVDAATVREVGGIPPDYRLQGEEGTGRTVLLVAGFACDYVVDGRRFPGVSYSNVTANLDAPPPSCPGCGAGGYDIWQFTTERYLHTVSARIGVFQPLLNHLSVSLEYVGGLPVSGRAVVPWGESPYEITAVNPPNAVPFFRGLDTCSSSPGPAADPAGCFPSDHWYRDQGDVYTAHANCAVSGGASMVTVTPAPGTPLARMLGGTRTLPGLWLRTEDAAAFMDLATRFHGGLASRPTCLG